MQTLLLALALLPTATAMGIYVPEGCMETPGGNLITKFDLDDVCFNPGGLAELLFSRRCTDDTAYLLECYDACVEEGKAQDPPIEYKWADIGEDSPAGEFICGHSDPVVCYCATGCPGTLGDSQGLIAGPCGADEPVKNND